VPVAADLELGDGCTVAAAGLSLLRGPGNREINA